MSQSYCIYSHVSPSGKVYIGQSNNYKRRWGYNGEHYLNKKPNGEYIQRLFARAILKYGWNNFEHNIILEDITKAEADYAEKYLIKWNKLHGISYNCTDGGEGTSGVHQAISEERRKAISEFMKANHPMKGKHHTPEALEKIIAANRNRTYTKEQKEAMAERCRKLHEISITEATRKKLSDYRKSHPETWVGGWNKKEVHQYDLNGKYITSYSSAMEASSHIGKDISSDISSCIKGRTVSAGGYFWRPYKVESIDISNYRVLKTTNGARIYDMSSKGKAKRRKCHGKPVNQYSLEGKYLNTYDSVTSAGDALRGYHSGINKCCSKSSPKYQTAGGYLWEYDTVDNRKDKTAV